MLLAATIVGNSSTSVSFMQACKALRATNALDSQSLAASGPLGTSQLSTLMLVACEGSITAAVSARYTTNRLAVTDMADASVSACADAAKPGRAASAMMASNLASSPPSSMRRDSLISASIVALE